MQDNRILNYLHSVILIEDQREELEWLWRELPWIQQDLVYPPIVLEKDWTKTTAERYVALLEGTNILESPANREIFIQKICTIRSTLILDALWVRRSWRGWISECLIKELEGSFINQLPIYLWMQDHLDDGGEYIQQWVDHAKRYNGNLDSVIDEETLPFILKEHILDDYPEIVKKSMKCMHSMHDSKVFYHLTVLPIDLWIRFAGPHLGNLSQEGWKMVVNSAASAGRTDILDYLVDTWSDVDVMGLVKSQAHWGMDYHIDLTVIPWLLDAGEDPDELLKLVGHNLDSSLVSYSPQTVKALGDIKNRMPKLFEQLDKRSALIHSGYRDNSYTRTLLDMESQPGFATRQPANWGGYWNWLHGSLVSRMEDRDYLDDIWDKVHWTMTVTASGSPRRWFELESMLGCWDLLMTVGYRPDLATWLQVLATVSKYSLVVVRDFYHRYSDRAPQITAEGDATGWLLALDPRFLEYLISELDLPALSVLVRDYLDVPEKSSKSSYASYEGDEEYFDDGRDVCIMGENPPRDRPATVRQVAQSLLYFHSHTGYFQNPIMRNHRVVPVMCDAWLVAGQDGWRDDFLPKIVQHANVDGIHLTSTIFDLVRVYPGWDAVKCARYLVDPPGVTEFKNSYAWQVAEFLNEISPQNMNVRIQFEINDSKFMYSLVFCGYPPLTDKAEMVDDAQVYTMVTQ